MNDDDSNNADDAYTDVLVEDFLSKLDQLADVMISFREQLSRKVSKKQYEHAKARLNILEYSLKNLISSNEIQDTRISKLE